MRTKNSNRGNCANWLICVDEGEVDQPAVQPQVQLALLFGTMMMRRCVLRPARATAAAHASGSARRAPLACRCSASTAAPEVTTAPQQKAEGEAGVKVERRWVLLTTSSKHTPCMLMLCTLVNGKLHGNT